VPSWLSGPKIAGVGIGSGALAPGAVAANGSGSAVPRVAAVGSGLLWLATSRIRGRVIVSQVQWVVSLRQASVRTALGSDCLCPTIALTVK